MSGQRHGAPIPPAPHYDLTDFPAGVEVLVGLATPMSRYLEEERAGLHDEDLCPELRPRPGLTMRGGRG